MGSAAVAAALLPAAPADPAYRSAWADLSPCGDFRWRLGRRWSPGATVGFVMLNPSHATGDRDDPTLRKCIALATGWGYGALIVANLYPFRTPDPDQLRQWLRPASADHNAHVAETLQRNVAEVAAAMSPCDRVVVAWGVGLGPEQAAWAETVMADLAEARGSRELWAVGTTRHGSPKHPLARGRERVRDDQPMLLWRDAE